tara:strand:+ start:659 stop:943 length:285 start_codon:yes stop_codon:yes gene_type:complete
MFDTSMMTKFDRVEADDKAPDGPNRGARYATDWTVGEERFRVSSIDNHYTTETMLFRIEEDGINYFELWADREFYTNPSQHAKFLGEYLQNLGS